MKIANIDIVCNEYDSEVLYVGAKEIGESLELN